MEIIDDKQTLATFLRQGPVFHLYEIGDLDPFFWPRTRWFGLRDSDGALTEVALLYDGHPIPAILCLGPGAATRRKTLLGELVPLLPDRFYGHLSGGSEVLCSAGWDISWQKSSCKMQLKSRHALPPHSDDVTNLGPDSVDDVMALLALAYPDNFFDPRMLESGFYCGIRADRALVAMAGVHVYSAEYRVAALGNIATHPDHRGRGLCRRVTAALCHRLLPTTDVIGLNVVATNRAAIAAYENLGFEVKAGYTEFLFERRTA